MRLRSKDRSRKRTKKRRPTESIFTNKVRRRKITVDGQVVGEEVATLGFGFDFVITTEKDK